MRVLSYYASLLFLFAATAAADFTAGLNAYDRGDFATAYREWLPVAQGGDANAQFNMGLLYASGKGVPDDHLQAAEWYRKAAGQGVAAAEYNLGVMYANGDGVPRDVNEAVKWLQRASDHGIPMGREALADLYGGSVQNYARSLEWHGQQAEKGDPVAQFDLGLMYDLGHGVPRNYEEAMKWYRKAADQGYAPAMTNIAVLYYNQEGVKRDLVQAYAWFARARMAHDPRAGELLQMTVDKMKGDQVRQGEALAANWHPQKPAAAPPVDMAALDANLFKQPGARAISQTKDSASPPASSPRGEAAREAPPEAPVTGVARVVALGDVRDCVESCVRTLQAAGLLDGESNWIGGNTHLVVTAGRVEGTLANLLDHLQPQAERSGGAVHVLVGPGASVEINDSLFVYDAYYRSERELDAVLRDRHAGRIVAGHGDGVHGIVPQFHGKLIVNADPERQGCLVVENDNPYALYRGRGLALPGDDGADLARYRRQVAALVMP